MAPGVVGVRTPDVIFLATPTPAHEVREVHSASGIRLLGWGYVTPRRTFGVAKKDDIGVRTPTTPAADSTGWPCAGRAEVVGRARKGCASLVCSVRKACAVGAVGAVCVR